MWRGHRCPAKCLHLLASQYPKSAFSLIPHPCSRMAAWAFEAWEACCICLFPYLCCALYRPFVGWMDGVFQHMRQWDPIPSTVNRQ